MTRVNILYARDSGGDLVAPQMDAQGRVKLASVWVATREDYESTYPKKVFASLSAAEKWKAEQHNGYDYLIDEFEVQS